MIGTRISEGRYGFVPMTGVLAVPVKNMPDDVDYALIESDDAAISGSFHVIRDGNYISQSSSLTPGHSLKLNFSNLGENYTFYFPIAAGNIPAGLRVTVGNSSDPDAKMTITTQRALAISNGKIALSPEVPFTPVDQQWADYMEGSFLDDFIWGQRGWGDVWVPVTIQRSGLHPEKYRIANPYSIAAADNGYTPATAGIVTDDYFVFYIDGESVSFNNFNPGVEDSVNRPLTINYRSAMAQYTHIVSALADGSVTEVQFAGYYTIAGNQYTKDDFDDNPKIHLIFDQPEKYLEVAEGEFIDEKLWGLHGWGSTRVPVKLLQSTLTSTKFRVPNPYLIAKEQFSYSTYTEGITGADYIEFEIQSEDAVRYATYYAGIEDKASGGNPMKVWYPLDWGSGYTAAAALNKVISYRADGLPEEIQMVPIYSDVNPSNYGYKYTDNSGAPSHLYFPVVDNETWTAVGTVQFKDDFWVGNRLGQGTDRFVDATLEQSNSNNKRFRIANPYPDLITLVSANSNYVYPTGNESPYLVMTIADDNTVTYDEFRPGIGDASRELAICHPAEWNTLSGDSKTGNMSAVTSYMANGLPYEIKLYAMYHEVGNYIASGVSGNYIYSRDTDGYGDVIVIRFPEVWNSIGNGRLWDKLVWSCAGITDYVSAEFQQNQNNANQFRIAKPYPGANSGEWFVFDVTDPDKVTSENYFVDYEVSATGTASFKPWIRNGVDYGYNCSKVLLYQANGLPSVVEIGPCYRGDAFLPSYDYAYEIGRDHEDLAIEIVFPGCEPYESQLYSATATHYGNPLKAEFHNPIASLDLPTGTLKSMKVKISGIDLSYVTGLRLWDDYYGWIDNNYIAPDANGVVTMTTFLNTVTSGHHLDLNMWLSYAPIGAAATFDIQEIVMEIGGADRTLVINQDATTAHLTGIVVNTGGDVVNVRGGEETVNAFRIPALVTSKAGTLIAAYDVRYAHSGDLQADIDVGVKRSTDGGQTWSDLILAMDMGLYDGKGQAENGIGDPCLLVDENTGDIFCFAVWTWGHADAGDTRSLAWAGKGYSYKDTPQLMMVKSSDDGLTWSAPISITQQIKKYDWRMTFQGPGRGITMKDGTLVIPIQHQEGETKIMNGLYPLNSGIAYSTDHGITWHAHNLAHTVTSEACVAEIEPGVLLLSMRDETGSRARRNYVTTDLGRTWTAHASNGKLIEPTCEASMIHVDAAKNSLGKDLVIFSNPHATDGRHHMTIQISEDHGVTWPHSLCVDSGGSLGYSCLTMVNPSTVGILYESSRGNIYFQAVPLTAIVK